ncbi:MAG: BamA/TamA family outer membrane protein [Flavobacteriales bacterium]
MKDLEEGEQLLVKNQVELRANSNIDVETLQNIIKQKPNTKLFFFFRFNAWIYNRLDKETLAQKREKKQVRLDKKNDKRVSKGKNPINETNETWRDRIKSNLGEKPTVYNPDKMENSKEQLQIYMKKNGYFSAEITHLLKEKTKKKVVSRYIIKPGKATEVNRIKWEVKDTLINSFLPEIKRRSELNMGSRFDVEKLDDEREGIASLLNNSGFYRFSKEYVSFEVDTLKTPLKADLIVRIKNPTQESNLKPDSLVSVPHKQYILGRVDFHLDYSPLAKSYEPTDRLLLDNHTFEYIGELDFDDVLLTSNILLEQGALYELKDVENTYKRLRSLGVFNYINIEFSEGDYRAGTYRLKCDIYLNSGKSQSTGIEFTGTHRDGIWGVNSESSYSHNNVFKGAERLELKFVVGAEAVRPVSEVDSEDNIGENINDNLRINSFILGPELSLNFHKLMFLPGLTKRSSSPLTKISAVYNFQVRPDFERSLVEVNLGWKFQESQRSSIYISPLDVSAIQITKSEAFQNRLDDLNDLFLINSYLDTYISSVKGAWDYSTQIQQFQRRYVYNRISVESAGILPRTLFEFSNQKVDENGSYRINDIRFAQYLRFENDFRYYRNFSKNQSIANRIDFGYGLPYGNSQVLPFEKSFFAGGANGIRAWQARALGPGSYQDSTALISYNNLGEVKLTLSSEYRFDLTNILEGAVFIDAGNIWVVDDEDGRVGTEFSSDFVNQIAVGGGVGFRLDFDFFLIRFDFGFRLKDPSLESGERWFWQPKESYENYLDDLRSRDLTTETRYNFNPNFNLGIGYPF